MASPASSTSSSGSTDDLQLSEFQTAVLSTVGLAVVRDGAKQTLVTPPSSSSNTPTSSSVPKASRKRKQTDADAQLEQLVAVHKALVDLRKTTAEKTAEQQKKDSEEVKARADLTAKIEASARAKKKKCDAAMKAQDAVDEFAADLERRIAKVKRQLALCVLSAYSHAIIYLSAVKGKKLQLKATELLSASNEQTDNHAALLQEYHDLTGTDYKEKPTATKICCIRP